MQGGTSTHAPMLPHTVLRLLGAGLQGLYADLLDQPLPAGMTDALARIREVPHLLPGPPVWTHARVRDASTVGHRPVMGL
jgi:hypothetical protein